MTTETLVNLTVPMVVRDIESVLETYSQNAYRRAFAIPEMRRKLEAYVLSRVPNQYAVASEEDTSFENLDRIALSHVSERSRVERVICDGIECVLQDNADKIGHQLPVDDNPCTAPSHWFG
ncbi:MAG: hypothetical protein AAFX40_18990 [Cyanobacteria bacterium J06639_1]